jgi:hypothetical protein
MKGFPRLERVDTASALNPRNNARPYNEATSPVSEFNLAFSLIFLVSMKPNLLELLRPVLLRLVLLPDYIPFARRNLKVVALRLSASILDCKFCHRLYLSCGFQKLIRVGRG